MKVVYWCPALDAPTGGVRVIYRHCDQLNSLGVDAYVFHWERPDFTCSWFQHDSRILRSGRIDKASDISIIPEYVAAQLAKRLRESGARYGIFVQNPHPSPFAGGPASAEETREAYRHAELVITISDHTSAFVRFFHPDLDERRIVQVVPAVHGCFQAPKKKVVAYMPRKLPAHGLLIERLGALALPRGWTLTPLDNLSLEAVHDRLAESAIFISLSEMEGLGLPPLEAAISGNFVVGYSGGGGDEYFDKPLFTKVEHGDLRRLFAEISELAHWSEHGALQTEPVRRAIQHLQARYSLKAERDSLARLKARLQDAGEPPR